MSVIDILTRVDAICSKYDRYDVDKLKENQISSNDPFLRLYSVVEADIENARQKAESATTEKNKAVVATLNAEIRRTKVRLREELPKLQRLAQKKVKGVSKDDIASRSDLVLALEEKIDSIPDGTNTVNRRNGGWKASATRMEIKIDSQSPDELHNEYFQQSEESSNFRQEFDRRKTKQDEGLEMISEGLDSLRNIAQDMNEELDRQVPLVDEIDTKVDKATSSLKNTNVRLKDTVTKLRSSRNFCIDIILLIIILGIAAYLYNVLKK